jgi:hypothetical protein
MFGRDPDGAGANVSSPAAAFHDRLALGHFQFRRRGVWEGVDELVLLAALFPDLGSRHFELGQSYRNPALLAKMAATRRTT